MQQYFPLSAKDPDEEFRFDYNSPFQWTSNNEKYNFKQKNGKYKSVFTYNTGSLTLDVDYINNDRIKDDLFTKILRSGIVFFCYLFLLCTAPFSLWFYIKRIAPNERVVVFQLGRLQPIRGPGLTCILPWIDRWQRVDLRMREFAIPPQQLIMSDGSIVEIGIEIRFRISDIVKSVLAIKNFDHAVRQLGQTSVVTFFQKVTLQDLSRGKDIIAAKLQAHLNAATQLWGLEVSRIVISPPKILQDSKERSPVESLLSSLQSVLKMPSNPVQSLPVSRDIQTPLLSDTGNSVRSIMRNTVLPALQHNSHQHLDEPGAVYKLVIKGVGGETFMFDSKTGRAAEGDASSGMEEPHVTITLQDTDFMELANGKLSPLQAYMSGRLEVAGNINLCNHLKGFLKL